MIIYFRILLYFIFFFEEQVNQDVELGRIEASGQTHFYKRNIGNILNLDWWYKLNNYPFRCAAKPFSRFIITLSSGLPLNLFEIKNKFSQEISKN